jgi:hypothetical protein
VITAVESPADRAPAAALDLAVLDLAAYLDRIGVPGATAPDLPTLRRIVAGHAQSIAYENLDPFLGHEPRLDIAGLEAKLVRGGRAATASSRTRCCAPRSTRWATAPPGSPRACCGAGRRMHRYRRAVTCSCGSTCPKGRTSSTSDSAA